MFYLYEIIEVLLSLNRLHNWKQGEYRCNLFHYYMTKVALECRNKDNSSTCYYRLLPTNGL